MAEDTSDKRAKVRDRLNESGPLLCTLSSRLATYRNRLLRPISANFAFFTLPIYSSPDAYTHLLQDISVIRQACSIRWQRSLLESCNVPFDTVGYNQSVRWYGVGNASRLSVGL